MRGSFVSRAPGPQVAIVGKRVTDRKHGPGVGVFVGAKVMFDPFLHEGNGALAQQVDVPCQCSAAPKHAAVQSVIPLDKSDALFHECHSRQSGGSCPS